MGESQKIDLNTLNEFISPDYWRDKEESFKVGVLGIGMKAKGKYRRIGDKVFIYRIELIEESPSEKITGLPDCVED